MGAPGERNVSSKLLVLRVHSQLCAVPIHCVLETCRPLPTEPVPNLAPFVLGLALIRARPTPVLDARRLLGQVTDRAPGRYVTLKVDETSERVVTLAVDEVVGIREVTSSQLEELPTLLSGDESLLSALGTLDGELLLLLERARLLPDRSWPELEAAGARV